MLGLISRSNIIVLPNLLFSFAGDTLWGLMVFWLFRMLIPSTSIIVSACLAICFSFSIEFSQLYSASWIDNVRATRLGGLVLGFGFKLSDLLCYMLGIAIGAMLDRVLFNDAFKGRGDQRGVKQD